MNLRETAVLSVFILRLLIVKSNCELISDYFFYKNVSSLVIFTCQGAKYDLTMQKKFGNVNFNVAFGELGKSPNISRRLKTRHRKLGVSIDLRCLNDSTIKMLFLDINNCRFFEELHSWFLIADEINKIIDSVATLPLMMSTDLVIANPSDINSVNSSQSQSFDLHDVYYPAKHLNTKLNITKFGTWNENTGLDVRLTQHKISRRSNLHGLVLRVAFLINSKPRNIDVSTFLTDSTDPVKDSHPKFGFTILNHFADLYNFTIDASQSPMWKDKDVLGPIVRGILKNETDISGTPVSVNGPRLSVIKYTLLNIPFRTCFIFRSPPLRQMNVLLFFKPFDVEVWKCLVATSIIVFWCLNFALKLEIPRTFFERFTDSIFIISSTLCQQGTTDEITRLTTRTVYFHLLVLSFVLFNCYSASIVSIRINRSISKINDSLNELKKLNFKMSSEPMTYFSFFIKRKDWETEIFYNTSWKAVPDADRFQPPNYGIKMLQKGFYAYHTHPDVSYPIIERTFSNKEICELTEVRLGKSPTYFVVHYNSSYQEIAKIGCAKLIETGLRARLIIRHSGRKPMCLAEVLSADSVDFFEIAHTLAFLILGALLSIAMILVEKIVHLQSILCGNLRDPRRYSDYA